MRRLRNHGSPRRYVHEELGWNSRLDAMQAAILRVKLKYVEGWNEARRQRAARYDQLFAEAGLAISAAGESASRDSNSPIQLPDPPALHRGALTMFFISTSSAPTAATNCASSSPRARSGRRSTIPSRCTLQPCFVYLGYREGDFPEAERAAKEVLALPMFPELTEEEQRWVVKSIADFYC